MLRLTLLAPEVVEAIAEGRQGEGVTLPWLMGQWLEEWVRWQRRVETCNGQSK